jgi:hypothetical protein
MNSNEVNTTEKLSDDSIESRANVSLAVRRYVRSAERFKQASADFNKACQDLRGQLVRSLRFASRIEGYLYLVICDEDGNFDVEKIDEL